MSKRVVLIRHGHRQVNAFDRDNALSEEGERQAVLLRDFYARRFGRPLRSPRLYVSPKLRCRQTLLPLERYLGISSSIDDGLDESGNHSYSLAERVEHVLKRTLSGPDALTILCSHGDWIPVAVQQLVGLYLDPAKGSWTEFSVNPDGRAELQWCVPDLAVFAEGGIAVGDVSG